MSRFASVKNARSTGRGNYCPNFAMTYLIEIDKAVFNTSRDGKNAFILDFTVRKVLVGETHDADGRLRADSAGRTVPTKGEQRNWYCNLSNDAGPGDMRKFAELIWEMLEMGDDAPTDEQVLEICEQLVSDAQPLAPHDGQPGVLLRLVTYNRNRRDGGPFTIHEWYRPTAADLDTLRAA